MKAPTCGIVHALIRITVQRLGLLTLAALMTLSMVSTGTAGAEEFELTLRDHQTETRTRTRVQRSHEDRDSRHRRVRRHVPRYDSLSARFGFRGGLESRFTSDGNWDEPHDFVGIEYIGMPTRHFGVSLYASYFQDDETRWNAGGRTHEVTLNGVPFHITFLGFIPLGSPYVELYGGGGPTFFNYWLTDTPPERIRGDEDTNGRKYGVNTRWGLNFILGRQFELFGEYGYTWLASEEFGRQGPQVSGGLRVRIP